MNDIDYEFLAGTRLFFGTSAQECATMLECLGSQTKAYERGEYIYMMGQRVRALGLMLAGSVNIEHIDVWGNTTIMGHIGIGSVFAETYAALGNEPLMVSVVAAEDCTVLFLNTGRVLATCSHACPYHTRISENLLSIFARKNLGLSQRMFHITPKTLRSKVLAYLSSEAERTQSHEFDIPFDRQQLANYLACDRSALSAELSRMQKDGLIETKRSHFKLLDAFM